MTFKTKDLNILAHSGNFSLWHLKSQEDAAVPGYLDRASGMVRDGDVILSCRKGAATTILTVTANKDGKVTVEALGSMGNLSPAATPAPQPSPPEPAKVQVDTPAPKPATKKGK